MLVTDAPDTNLACCIFNTLMISCNAFVLTWGLACCIFNTLMISCNACVLTWGHRCDVAYILLTWSDMRSSLWRSLHSHDMAYLPYFPSSCVTCVQSADQSGKYCSPVIYIVHVESYDKGVVAQMLPNYFSNFVPIKYILMVKWSLLFMWNV